MAIHIRPFEGITEVDIDAFEKENPLHDYDLSKGISPYKSTQPFPQLRNIDINHWETILKNRLISVNLNFSYCMFYFEKGIPDDEWHISPGKQGQSVQYHPHFENEHYSNFYNFIYFADIFFLKAYTLCETIGHLLFKLYDIKIDENDSRDQISFNSAIFHLKNENRSLNRALNKVKHSTPFQKGVRMRNDIAHNHPPYEITSGVKFTSTGGSFGVGDYTTSKEIKKVMIGFLESIRAIFEALHKHTAFDS